MAKQMAWHVPVWHGTQPAAGGGKNNVGRDIIVPLVDTNPPGVANPIPELENWLVKRVIGQFMLQGTQAVSEHGFLHHRIYPVSSDNLGITIRDLGNADDAESDFLWHMVEPWSTVYNADVWGNWQAQNSGNPTATWQAGRYGHFDVGVNRRITEGNTLIWHTQINTTNAPVDDEFDLFMWCRVLVQEG